MFLMFWYAKDAEYGFFMPSCKGVFDIHAPSRQGG